MAHQINTWNRFNGKYFYVNNLLMRFVFLEDLPVTLTIKISLKSKARPEHMSKQPMSSNFIEKF